MTAIVVDQGLRIPMGDGTVLDGDVVIPERCQGLVLFAHGSGSSRHSPRNRAVASGLWDRGFATLLIDLLTMDEEAVDLRTRDLRFDIDLLAGRLAETSTWLAAQPDTRDLPVGYFGASTGAAAEGLASPWRLEIVPGATHLFEEAGALEEVTVPSTSGRR